MSLLKQLRIIIATNILLVLVYIWGNYIIWAEFSSYPTSERFVVYNAFSIIDSIAGTNGITVITNFPFWLFFVAIAVNVYFIVRLQKSKFDTKSSPE
jgi:hypothetical protein